MIKKCQFACASKYQDEKYGPGNRVMNPTTKGVGKTMYRCSVCGKDETVSKK